MNEPTATNGQPKKRRILPIVLMALALAVAILVTAILQIVNGPLVTLASALKKTMDAKSATAVVELELAGQTLELEMQIRLDTDARELIAYGSMEADGLELTVAICDGQLITGAEYGIASFYTSEDIGQTIDALFDSLQDDSRSVNLAGLLDRIDVQTDGELYRNLSRDSAKKCFLKLALKANHESVLRRYAGYSRCEEDGETCYNFSPELYVLSQMALKAFRSAFYTSDAYEAAQRELDDMHTLLDAMHFSLSVGIRDGYASSIRLSTDVGGSEIAAKISLRDFGTAEVDRNALEEAVLKAK